MSEVEFFGPGVETEPERPAPPTSLRRVPLRPVQSRTVLLASAALWLLAAALCVAAPFGSLYRITLANGIPTEYVDGWGRYSTPNLGGTATHGTRFGITFCVVAAVLFAVAITSALASSRDNRAVARGALIAGIGALGALVGVLVSAALKARSAIAAFHAEIRIELRDTADPASSTLSARAHYGSLFAWGTAAVLCAVLALLLPVLVGVTAAAVSRRRVDTEAVVPEHHPDDEALTEQSDGVVR